jgi:CshA-type fibril repeat protein
MQFGSSDTDPARRTPASDHAPVDAPATGTPIPDGAIYPDHEDLEDIEETIRRSPLERRAGGVAWAKDEDAPDYAHLIEADRLGVAPSKDFRLTPDILDLIIRANVFAPKGPDDMIVFALRGGMLMSGAKAENQDWLDIQDTRPNHKDFRCTIGYYHQKTRKLSGYQASTVPTAACVTGYATRGSPANLLPTGCYVFRVGIHNISKPARQVNPALRMTEPDKPGTDATTTVLRSKKDMTYKHDDFWDMCTPTDNVHCAFYFDRFSSAGCLTIQGDRTSGPWGNFQALLKPLPHNTRIDVLLVTGREAAIAARLIAEGRHQDADLVGKTLGRLRLGSEGPAVSRLQVRLGSTGTGYFGAATRSAMVVKERELGKVASDGIFSPADDVQFGWDVFSPAAPGSPSATAAPGTASQSAEQSPDASTLVLVAGPAAQLSADGKSLVVPGEGTWTVGPDPGTISFAPLPGFVGSPQPVRYRISDKTGTAAVAPVKPPHRGPALGHDTATTRQNEPVVISVLDNDAGLDGQLVVTSMRFVNRRTGVVSADGKTFQALDHGTWQIQPDGRIMFTPKVGFAGTALATYQVADDHGATAQADVTATVTPAEPTSAAASPTTAGPSPIVVDVAAPAASPEAPASSASTPPPINPALTGNMRIGEENLRRFAPKGKAGYVNAILQGEQYLAEYGLNNNPRRLCHFLAQIAHESGGFTIDRESMNYTTARRIMQVWPSRFPTVEFAQQFLNNEEKLANQVYQGRLGNTQPGDGFRYRGRGLIQITGRGAYREFGRKLGVDLEGNPDLACDPEVALKIAIRTWSDTRPSGERTTNELADANKIEAITKRINGGYNGLDDRKARFHSAWSIWSDGAASVVEDQDVLERGDSGPRVDKMQRLLVRAGFLPADETIDGRFGGNTQQSLMRFQLANKLNVNGVVDAATWAALEKAPVVNPEPAATARRSAPSREWPPARRDAITPARREYMRLASAMLAILAAAAFILQTLHGSAGIATYIPAAVLTAALLLWLATLWPRHRVNREDDALADPARAASAATASDNAAGQDRQNLDTELRKLGFDDSYFAEPDVVRAMPAQPEDAGPLVGAHHDGAPAPLPTLPAARAVSAAGGARPFAVSGVSAPFVVISMFGGDNNLSSQVQKDLGEMAAGIKKYGNVTVIGLADTEDGPGTVVEVTPSGIRTIERLGEIDTGDPETLARFVSRALVTYPSARKAIGFWDHGTGVFDEKDAAEVVLDRNLRRRVRTPARRLLFSAAQRDAIVKDPGTRAMLHDNSGGVLTNLEAGAMLRAAFSRAGQHQRIDMLYSDTCLNGMIEVVEELGEFAQCFVASCDTEPPGGWDYEEWFRLIGQSFPGNPEGLASHAVTAFGTSYNGRTEHYPCTLSALVTDNQVTEAFASLVDTCEKGGLEAFSILNLARGRSQAYDQRDTYDLLAFCDVLIRATANRSGPINEAARALKVECERSVISSIAHGPTVTAARGLAFWFPSSEKSLRSDIETYRKLKFNRLTNWGEYLSTMYNVDVVA